MYYKDNIDNGLLYNNSLAKSINKCQKRARMLDDWAKVQSNIKVTCYKSIHYYTTIRRI